mgnify:FL=1
MRNENTLTQTASLQQNKQKNNSINLTTNEWFRFILFNKTIIHIPLNFMFYN